MYVWDRSKIENGFKQVECSQHKKLRNIKIIPAKIFYLETPTSYGPVNQRVNGCLQNRPKYIMGEH